MTDHLQNEQTECESKGITRSQVNLLIDIVAFVAFVFLVSTGVLMRYVLPPGSGHFRTIWGLDRHEWGSIHFWISVCFLVILVFHIVLHWRWIVCVICGKPRDPSGARLALGLVGLLALVAMAASPVMSPVRHDLGHGGGGMSRHHSGPSHEFIRGSMTLGEVEANTGVPAEHILKELGLPSDVRSDERLGRLRRMHGFRMSDVRQIVYEYEQDSQQIGETGE